jgi:hypothetical protein
MSQYICGSSGQFFSISAIASDTENARALGHREISLTGADRAVKGMLIRSPSSALLGLEKLHLFDGRKWIGAIASKTR